MYFTCAKVISNDLDGTEDMVIFVLQCKIIHSVMQNNYALSGIANCFLTVRRHLGCSCL